MTGVSLIGRAIVADCTDSPRGGDSSHLRTGRTGRDGDLGRDFSLRDAPFVFGAASLTFSSTACVLPLVGLLVTFGGGSSFDASTLAFRLVDFLAVDFVTVVVVSTTSGTSASSTVFPLGAEFLTARDFVFPRPRPIFFTGAGAGAGAGSSSSITSSTTAFVVFTRFDFRTNWKSSSRSKSATAAVLSARNPRSASSS